MFCQKCGSRIGDDARFCNKCGAQVAVIPQQSQPIPSQTPVYRVGNEISGEYVAGAPYGQYPPQTVYIVKDNKTDLERNAKIFKTAMAIGSAILMNIALIITFFGEIFKNIEESISDLIGDEYFMKYAGDELATAIIIMFVLFIIAALFANAALLDLLRYDSMSKGCLWAATGAYLIAFFICVFNEDIEPSGLFVFLMILFGIGIGLGEVNAGAEFVGSGKSLSNTGRSLLGAAPKHIQTSASYEGDYPDMECFDLLVEKTCLREHLYKTHPNNQFFITLQQLMLQKYTEMVNSNCNTNRRVFDYTDEKNKIFFVLSFDETKEFKCDIKINML